MTPNTTRQLAFLWSAQMISVAGDSIYQIALIWLILDITGSSTVTGLVAMSTYLPAMVFGLLAGVFADRYNRMGLMILSNLSQAMTVIMIPILLYYGWENAIYIGLLAFIRGSFSTLFPPALNSYVPMIVPAQKLVRANSILSTSQQLAYLIGPAIAGSLLGILSLHYLFVFDAGSFLIAIALLLLIPRPKKISIEAESPNRSWSELREGLKYVITHPTLRFMIGLTVINNVFIMGPAIVGMPILVKTALQGSASDYAFVEALMAAGMLIGSFVVYRINVRIKSGIILLSGMIIDGLTYSIFFLADSVSFVFVFIVIHGIGIPMITIARTAIIQRHAPNRYHGRLFSMVHLSVVGVTALSSGLIGIIANVVPIQTIFLSIGIGAALCGLVGFLHPRLRYLE